MSSAPRALFFTSATQRVELARQRYFEEGLLPSGIVSNAVLDSWSRCQRLGYDPQRSVEFDLVSNSRVQLALQRHRQLVDAWTSELTELERTLAGTSCSAILTDPSGVLVAITGGGRAQDVITPVAHRIGVNLSEDVAGTTAPALVVKTGKAITVLGGEHYFDRVKPMNCAAAPIHNTRGQLAGVLNISSEGLPFDFDAAAVVSLYATSIENRLLTAQANEHLLLRLQVSPSLLDTPMVGLAGIDGQGRLAWANGVASRLLGMDLSGTQDRLPGVDSILGVSLDRLLALPQEGATQMRLANGLSVWMRAFMQAPDGLRGLNIRRETTEAPPTAPCLPASVAPGPSAPAFEERLHDAAATSADPLPDTPPSLRASDKELIARTVRAFGGNISEAARQLRVSRGLIYRRLKQAQGDCP